MLGKPIPEGLRRERSGRRTKSIDRLDRIIKLGGEVGELFSIFESDEEEKDHRATLSNIDNMAFDDLDLGTRADPATYSLYGKLINKECKKKGIPSPYPGGIEWTFRYTKDRVMTVNTLIYLLIQRRTAEQFILDLKEWIDLLQEEVSTSEAKNKELNEVIAEWDEKFASFNPEKEIKRKTDAFRAKEELFRQKEETFQKQTEAFKKKEQQMEIDLKKVNKELAIIKRAKTDVERKNQLIQNQKRNLEIQYRNIQKRLKSKLDKVSKKSSSSFNMQMIGELTLFETEDEKRLRKKRDPQKIVSDISEEWNQNILSNFEELKVENELLERELEELKQKCPAIIEGKEYHRSPGSESLGPPLPNRDTEGILGEENCSQQSVYNFYFDRLTEIFTEFVPESVEEIPMLLDSYPDKEHFIYEEVCYQFGITPVAEYVGAAARAARTSVSESKRTKSRVKIVSFQYDETKSEETGRAPSRHMPTNSINSLPWIDDYVMDGLSVELDKGWSFAESCSAVSPFMEGVSPTKSGKEKIHSPV